MINKTKVLLRICAVLSVLWVLYCFTENYSTILSFQINDFLKIGITPLVIFWGVVWVVFGFKSR